MARIGFIGLGNMGLPMAQNLIKAGHQVEGVDVNPASVEKLKAAGGAAVDMPGVAAGRADVVITMLPAGQHVRDVYLSPGGIVESANPGTLLIDCSTIDVATARDVAKAAEARGLLMLDAPVSGGVGGATAGTLTFMVGGPAQPIVPDSRAAASVPTSVHSRSCSRWAKPSCTPAMPATGRRRRSATT